MLSRALSAVLPSFLGPCRVATTSWPLWNFWIRRLSLLSPPRCKRILLLSHGIFLWKQSFSTNLCLVAWIQTSTATTFYRNNAHFEYHKTVLNASIHYAATHNLILWNPEFIVHKLVHHASAQRLWRTISSHGCNLFPLPHDTIMSILDLIMCTSIAT